VCSEVQITVSQIIPLKDRLTRLQQILLDRAASSGWGIDPEVAALARHDYAVLRADLLEKGALKFILPDFLKQCRDLDRFWSFIKKKFGHYDERREFIWSSFEPAFDLIESSLGSPADNEITNLLSSVSSESIHEVWQVALKRRSTDPDGAITIARTLLETVCKHILTDKAIEFSEKDDLPKLYSLTANSLKLAPDQHTEKAFKQILGGCKTIIDGLATIRNRLSDAHGRAPGRAKPGSRHAEFVVNLAGAAAVFLLQTWQYQQGAS
jgi:hypothetical protein